MDSKQGYLSVDAHFKNMEPAGKYGPEYLTYVLWAITPEGRPKNLGEVVLNGTADSKLDVTTDLQAFGLGVCRHTRTARRVASARRWWRAKTLSSPSSSSMRSASWSP